mgnify:CR=1 FL=1
MSVYLEDLQPGMSADYGKTITEPASAYYDYITGKDLSHRMPLFVKPARKISVKN